MPHRELKCFENEREYIIAYSSDDAWDIWCEYMGEKKEDYCGISMEENWDTVGGDCMFTIYKDDSHTEKETMTIDEWIKKMGRGPLCSGE
jgi:hypothetical protein